MRSLDDEYFLSLKYLDKYSGEKSSQNILTSATEDVVYLNYKGDVDSLRKVYEGTVRKFLFETPDHLRVNFALLYLVYQRFPWADSNTMLEIVRRGAQVRNDASKGVSYLRTEYLVYTLFSLVHFPTDGAAGLESKLSIAGKALVSQIRLGTVSSDSMLKLLDRTAEYFTDKIVIAFAINAFLGRATTVKEATIFVSSPTKDQ